MYNIIRQCITYPAACGKKLTISELPLSNVTNVTETYITSINEKELKTGKGPRKHAVRP